MTGAGIGATADSDGGGPIGFAFGTLMGGTLGAQIYHFTGTAVCKERLKNCGADKFAVCIKNDNMATMCCGDGWDFMCYDKWHEVIDEITKRNPDSEFARECKAQLSASEASLRAHEILKIVEETHQTLDVTQHKVNETFALVNGAYRLVNSLVEVNRKLDEIKPIIDKTNQDLSGMIREKEERSRCDSEEKCSRCGGHYACVKVNSWSENVDGCCPTGFLTRCCETTTTTTTTATTTTTNERLTCRKAVWELHPDGLQKHENPDKFCGQADQHCYVLNCTVRHSIQFDWFFGYRAEWGCIESKKYFWANFNQSDGWKGKRFIDASCNPFFGAKHADMSNHNIFVPTFNFSV
uniref:Fibrinogen C-terminal domain-containing protein n=1 Tax=Globodera pallida TaxID=36090 RepID=A0A183CC85_GLOPA